MEKFTKLLNETEAKWLPILYKHVKQTFAADPLPSHNEEHHLRVWNYAKELMSELTARAVVIDKNALEEIMIAIFFHDTGMSINRDSNHGKESRRLCEKWMEEQRIPREKYSEKMLEAIEFHDDKSYHAQGRLTSGNKANLLSILNVCDDLDAFSYCGIYRYSEIYLLRGIAIDELGQQVISNASIRFGNFMNQCMQLPQMIKTHAPRYDVLENFFRQYNAQLRKDPDGRTIDHGPVHIIKIFYRQILGGINSVENLCLSEIDSNEGMYEKTFFENLRREWCCPTPALPGGEGERTNVITANHNEEEHQNSISTNLNVWEGERTNVITANHNEEEHQNSISTNLNVWEGEHTNVITANHNEEEHQNSISTNLNVWEGERTNVITANHNEEEHQNSISTNLNVWEGERTNVITANHNEEEHQNSISTNLNVGKRRGYMTANPRAYKLIKGFRDEVKKNPTKAEAVLWEYLRKKKTGYHIRRQQMMGDYIADFVCLKKKVVIEIDGKIHDFNKEADEIRTNRLNELGYIVIRFSNDEVLEFPSMVAKKIEYYLNNMI